MPTLLGLSCDPAPNFGYHCSAGATSLARELRRMNDSNGSQIDWFIFIVGSALLAAVVIPIVVAPEWSFASYLYFFYGLP
jgi:hypothetical protein